MGEVWKRGLKKKDGTEHIDIVDLCEGFYSHILQRLVLRNAGVVDDDVDLEFARLWVGEVVLGGRDEV